MTQPSVTLLLGRIPPDAAPATHLLAGPWCFVGEDARFPDWETRFTFAPDPFAPDPASLTNERSGYSTFTPNSFAPDAPDTLEQAARQAQGLAARCLPAIVQGLRPAHSSSLPPLPDAYWETLLAPWLLVATQQIVGYFERAQALVNAWGARPLRVPLLPEDTPFIFADEQEYTFYGVLNHTYIHWLFSRLLESVWPEAWEKVWVMPLNGCHAERSEESSLSQFLYTLAHKALLSLPFPRIKGFSLRQSLQYSVALWRNNSPHDYSRAFAPLAAHAPTLPFDPLPLLWRSMPQSLHTLTHPRHIAPAARPRLRVMGIQVYENAAYRQKMAVWRGAGHKCVCIQHGGNYGHVRTSPVVPVVEYGQHAFITWGWTQHSLGQGLGQQQGRFVPLPHAQLQGIRNAHQETSPSLLFVSTEINAFPYRMDSRPTPLQYVAYRAAKRDFFATLGATVRAQTQYRPYFTLPGTLEDAGWLLPQFPELRTCTGPLEPHILGCRLFVADHHGTTLLQALAANVPTVVYWDRAAWPLCPEADTLLNILADVGIWHRDATAAAQHSMLVWDAVPTWWHSPAVVDARARWCAAYALTTAGDIDAIWLETLGKI